MGHLSIYCESCGSNWNVYHRDDWKDWKSRTCPVCGKMIDPGTWDRQILRAFGEMEDANCELVKDHTQSHEPLFTVSYIPDVLFPNRGNTEEIEGLRDEIDNLQAVVKKLIDGLFQE